MKKTIIISLFLASLALAQPQTIAVLPALADRESKITPKQLNDLTKDIYIIAANTLPSKGFALMKQDMIIEMLGDSAYVADCEDGGSCVGRLIEKVIKSDFGMRCDIYTVDKQLVMYCELYGKPRGESIYRLIDAIKENVKNFAEMQVMVKKKVPDMFKKIPGASGAATPADVQGGISGLQSAGGSYEFSDQKRYLANITTDPEGAILSFNGSPDSHCAKTPCKVELAEGNVRIMAVLDQYEKADTMISIKQNNQNVNIKLKSSFGVLEIKSAYLEGIGANEDWNLTINGKAVYSLENNLPSGRYSVKLEHRCYEALSFNAGINKGKREVFDMASHVKLKKGGLVLSAENGGSPISEPVFVNGKQVGETPFSGTVPVCAAIEIGKSREKVNVVLKHNEKVSHVVKSGGTQPQTVKSSDVSNASGNSFTDSRNGQKYRIVKIGNQTWMAENLNYNASGSKCYENFEAYCEKYGRLYDWNTAMKACPSGWHLPSVAEWYALSNFAGGGKHLKAKSGWKDNEGKSGNGIDTYGFAALPGGFHSNSTGWIGYVGYWWSSSEYYNDSDYSLVNTFDSGWGFDDKYSLFNVRCVQD